MAGTSVVFFRKKSGHVPVLDWLITLKRRDRRAYAKCVVRIERLAEAGQELGRPEAAHLRRGIHELRIRRGRVHHRILYFFHQRHEAVLVHCLTKEGKVPEEDIKKARERMEAFRQDPDHHSYETGM